MDTVSPVSRPASVVRLAAWMLALAIVALSLLAALGPSVAVVDAPGVDDALMGPFRWMSTRGLA